MYRKEFNRQEICGKNDSLKNQIKTMILLWILKVGTDIFCEATAS